MSGEPLRLPCRVEAARDGPMWKFYVVNDGAESIDRVTLRQVEHEWGNQSGFEHPYVVLDNLVPGAREFIWQDDGEMRMELVLEVRRGGEEQQLTFAFPLLYRRQHLDVVDGLPVTAGSAEQQIGETSAIAAATARVLPRAQAIVLALTIWLVAIPLAHGILPWALSLTAARHGWTDGSPNLLNLLGLIPVACGALVLVWIGTIAFREIPPQVPLKLTPNRLITTGPYRRSRNPMYIAELMLWTGWTIVFGSVPVFIGLVVLFTGLQWIVLPREERALRRDLGATYKDYEARVPRWFT